MVAAVGIRRPARLLAAMMSLAAVAFASACGVGSGPTRAIDLTYVSYGGAMQDAMIAAWQVPYRGSHPGIRFINTSPPDMGQVQAQVQSGSVGWSIVSTPPWLASQNCGTLYERLDVPDLDEDQFPPNLHGECFVVAYRSSLIFSYNAKKWPDPATAPQTIQDFFDVQKFPGKRGVVPALGDGILEWALIADGVDPAGLYPLDVDRALAKWETIRADTTWAASAEVLSGQVVAEQVDLQLLAQPATLAALDGGAQVVPVWQTTMTSSSGLAIPLGAPYAEQSQEFLSFVLEPRQQARIAELAGVGPANLEAEPAWSENAAKVNAFGPANTGTSVPVDPVWWSQNWPDTSTKFNTWRTPPPPAA